MTQSYSENQKLCLKIVITKSNLTEYRVNCKKIKGQYYIKGKECVEVENCWYPVDSQYIIYDHFYSKWSLMSKAGKLKKGIVGLDEKGLPVIGFFTPNKGENVLVEDMNSGRQLYTLNQSLAESFCKEDLSSGKYYYNFTRGFDLNSLNRIRNVVDHRGKGYNIEDNKSEYSDKVKYYHTYTPKLNKHLRIFSNMLNGITFGAELETIKGYLPDHIQYKTGTVICRDGSLHDSDGTQGPEYTTIPMSGGKGVKNIIDLCRSLQSRNIIDKNCSYHLHIGNLPTSRAFIVALYELCYNIQDDLFKMFPYYKVDEPRYAGKDKNYCQKLEKLSTFKLSNKNKSSYCDYVNNNYIRIFHWLSGQIVPSRKFNRKNKVHPRGTEQNKWNRNARYFWVNFMNCIFSERNTIEFRIHQATMNPQKTITWLFICNAIVKTAMRKATQLIVGEKISFNDVLNYYSEEFKNTYGLAMSDYLKEYVRQRTEYFHKDYLTGNYVSVEEIENDSKFELPYPLISKIFK